MSNLGPPDRFYELCWRGGLSRSDREELTQWIQTHPELAAEIQEEMALTQSLHALRNSPVPSNFTSRVIGEVQRSAHRSHNKFRGACWWAGLKGRWMPRVAFVGILVLATVGSMVFVQQQHRAKIGESVSVLSEVAATPGAEIWSDFDAIRVLHAPAADVELLTLLQ